MQYRRLFSHTSKNFHWQINVIITIVAVWGGGIILTAFFLCVPMEKNWYPQVEGTCIPIIPFYYGLQIPNIVTDLLIIVVPIREVMLLQLNKRLKTGAITMFALGIITLVFDIVRLVALLELTAPEKMADFTCKAKYLDRCSQKINEHLTDDTITDNVIDVAVWTTIEPTMAIVAVCIPSVRTLYRRSRNSAHYTDGSTTLGNNSSIRELKSSANEEDVEAATIESPAPSMASPSASRSANGESRKNWPPVSMLLESERPFQRFEEFDGRQRT